MQDFEEELREQITEMVLLDEIDEDNLVAFIKWAKEKHLQSYKNGAQVGRRDKEKPATTKGRAFAKVEK